MLSKFLGPLVASSIVAATLVPSASAQVFEDVTRDAGLGGVSRDNSIYPDSVYGIGMCAADFDGDGDLDLVVPGNQLNQPTRHRYYRNEGGMRFTNLFDSVGITENLAVRTARAADVDNDGDLDLYFSNYENPPQLYINDGTGHFVDEAAARGLTHVTQAWGATFVDYDKDGWLDLYIGNRFDGNPFNGVPGNNIFYRNTGGGHFVDVTAETGTAQPGAASFCGVFFDFDEDGWQDLYTINDKGLSYQPNDLFRNDGSGRFMQVGDAVGAVDAIDAMGFDYLDVFNDGGLDYYVSDLSPDHLFRVWDPELGVFTDETYTFGLAGGYVGWAVHFLDYDNDGWQDLHVVHMNGPNHLYKNPAQPREAEVPWPLVSNPISPTTRQITAIAADFDNDGRVDILQRMMRSPGVRVQGLLMHRNVTPMRNWIKIDTIGSVSNRDGFGTRIVARTGDLVQRQYRRGGMGFLSGNDTRVHFGLGDHAVVDELTVTWPTGQVQVFKDVPANQTFVVREPSIDLIGVPSLGRACLIDMQCPDDAGHFYAVVLSGSNATQTPLPGGQMLPVRVDALTSLSLTPGNSLIHGNVAALHRGWGGALVTIPNMAGLSGLTLHAAAFTFDAFGRVRTVFPESVPLVIQ